MKKLAFSSLIVAVLSINIANVQAEPITFNFTADGVGGAINATTPSNGTRFTGMSLKVSILGDTDNIAKNLNSNGAQTGSKITTGLTGTYSLFNSSNVLFSEGSFNQNLVIGWFQNTGITFGNLTGNNSVTERFRITNTPGRTYDLASDVSYGGDAVVSNGIIAGSGLRLNAAGNGTFTAVSAVPEPETYAMMLAGLAVIGLAIRKRRLPGSALGTNFA